MSTAPFSVSPCDDLAYEYTNIPEHICCDFVIKINPGLSDEASHVFINIEDAHRQFDRVSSGDDYIELYEVSYWGDGSSNCTLLKSNF